MDEDMKKKPLFSTIYKQYANHAWTPQIAAGNFIGFIYFILFHINE